MNRALDADAKCPYYETADMNRIRCESCVKGARLHFVFQSREEMLKHKRRYCDSYRWYGCPYARQRTRDYSEE